MYVYLHVHQKVGFPGFLMDDLVVCAWLSGQSHPQVYGFVFIFVMIAVRFVPRHVWVDCAQLINI